MDDDFDMDLSLSSMATMDSSKEQAGLAKIDRYQLISELGSGAFGEVYLALDTVSDQRVALKLLSPELSDDPVELAKVKANFQLVSNLNHPNIAAVKHLHLVESVGHGDKELAIVAGNYLLVMEYVEGSTLSNWKCKFKDKKVPFTETLSIAKQVASALDCAHKNAVIHRDVKPSNIIIDTKGNVKLLDFGLAQSTLVTDDTKPVSSGTLPYMSPEQLNGEPQDKPTDLYALAVLIYQLLSGAVPFAAVFQTKDINLIRDVVNRDNAEPIAELNKQGNDVLLKALSKNKVDRLSTCGEMIKALEKGEAAGAEIPKQAKAGKPWALVAVALIAIAALAYVFLASETPMKSVTDDEETKTLSPVITESSKPREQEAVRENVVEKTIEKEKIKIVKVAVPVNPEEKYLDKLIPEMNAAKKTSLKLLSFKERHIFQEELEALELLSTNAKSLYKLGKYKSSLKFYTDFNLKTKALFKLESERKAYLTTKAKLSAQAKEFPFLLNESWGRAEAQSKDLAQKKQFVRAKEGLESLYIARKNFVKKYQQRAVAELLVKARMANEAGEWQEQKVAAAAILKITPNHLEAKKLFQEAVLELTPVLLISANVKAEVFDGDLHLGTTPLKKAFSAGDRLNIRVVALGKKTHTEFINVDFIGKKKVHFELKSSVPDFFTEVKNASYSNLLGLSKGSSKAQSWQKKLVYTQEHPLEIMLTKSKIKFRLIPAGTFMMGSDEDEDGRDDDEERKSVTIKQSFYISSTEITEAQYLSLKKGTGSSKPVVNVEQNEAINFIKDLARFEGVKGWTLSLPTEQQWEYAAKAGTQTTFYLGNHLSAKKVNFNGEYPYGDANEYPYRKKSLDAGFGKPNAFGLYNMLGNVSEWVLEESLAKGGSWKSEGEDCRPSKKQRIKEASEYIGFRIVMMINEQ